MVLRECDMALTGSGCELALRMKCQARGVVVQEGYFFEMRSRQNDRRNSYDAIRLVAACLVMISHGWALLGMLEEDFVWRLTKQGFSASWLGLAAFFSLSGFLIDRSSLNSDDWKSFARRRFLRLWPGLAFVIVFTTFVLGPILSSSRLATYLSSHQTWLYLAGLSVWGLRWKLPGMFPENPLPEVNGSLWTLPYESTLYFVSWKLRSQSASWKKNAPFVLFVALLFVRCFFYNVVKELEFRPLLMSLHKLLDFGLFYLAGSCIHRLWGRRKFLWWMFGLLLIVWVFSLGTEVIRRPLDFVVLPLGVILLGSIPVSPFDQAARFGDFSYGVYVWGFPVQQTLIQCVGAKNLTPFSLAVFGLICTLPIAFLSWHFIEKRALERKDLAIKLGRFKF